MTKNSWTRNDESNTAHCHQENEENQPSLTSHAASQSFCSESEVLGFLGGDTNGIHATSAHLGNVANWGLRFSFLIL
jgi:hypothetical protein